MFSGVVAELHRQVLLDGFLEVALEAADAGDRERIVCSSGE